MALSDVKVRSAKPEAKAYKLTDGEGMVCWFTLTVLSTREFVISLIVKRKFWIWEVSRSLAGGCQGSPG